VLLSIWRTLPKWDDALRTARLLSEPEMGPALTPVRWGWFGTRCRGSGDDNLNPGKPVGTVLLVFRPLCRPARMWHAAAPRVQHGIERSRQQADHCRAVQSHRS